MEAGILHLQGRHKNGVPFQPSNEGPNYVVTCIMYNNRVKKQRRDG